MRAPLFAVAGLLLALSVPCTCSTNYTQCLIDIRSPSFIASHLGNSSGATDNRGHPVQFSNTTTAITYRMCTEVCGPGPEQIQWSMFSQQFGSWLLPWLALVSQLPFGANDKFDNLVAMFLTVGSPTLAAYSLILTVLNDHWLARRFLSFNYPNTRNAFRILSSLQQSALRVNSEESLLSSLVVLPDNDEWWTELAEGLDYTYTWSIASVTSIVWVVIAYIFTVANSFIEQVGHSYNANGQGVGSLWLWLLPIVTSWLQISPKCDSLRVQLAVERANKIAYVATDGGTPELAGSGARPDNFAISIASCQMDRLRKDEGCPVPIFNYARFFPWVRATETVAEAFAAASKRARAHKSVNPDVEWSPKRKPGSLPHPTNREGTREQVDVYCLPANEDPFRETMWGPRVWTHMFVASLLALSLQWGTTSAAVVVVWFTPTVGLGCWSGSYILYGSLSTLVWMLLLTSSILAHYFTIMSGRSDSESTLCLWLVRNMSIGLRRLGKVLATVNTFWVVASSTFEFTNFYARCFCNSSVFMWGSDKAYHVLELNAGDISSMKGAWVGGIFLAAGSALVFMVFVNLLINPRIPPPTSDQS